MNSPSQTSRRLFLKQSAAAAGAALMLPTIVPSSVFGQNAPSQKLNFGLIGMGLMMGGHMGHLLGRDDSMILAVCDIAKGRRELAQNQINQSYARKLNKP